VSVAAEGYARSILVKTTTFFLHAAAVLSLLTPTTVGCGGSGAGTGGGASTTTTSATGTTTNLVATPEAAFSVTTDQPDGSVCPLAAGTEALGALTASMKTTTVTGGDGGAMIECSVLGSGPFEVDAAANNGTLGLEISIPALTAGATAASPAAGTVSLQAATSGSLYTGSCSFYFVPSTPEAVSAGSVWVAFTCPALTNPVTMASCPVAESYVLFESCISGS